MPFKIALSPTYKRKVGVETPNDKGTVDRSEFFVTFRRVDMNEVEELRALGEKEGQAAVMCRVMAGWSAMVDEDNQEVPFSPATRDAFLLIPPALHATAKEFWDSIFGARVKN